MSKSFSESCSFEFFDEDGEPKELYIQWDACDMGGMIWLKKRDAELLRDKLDEYLREVF